VARRALLPRRIRRAARWADASLRSPKVHIEVWIRGFRFPPKVIILAVRWVSPLRVSSRDGEELLAERGIAADPGNGYRWVQRCTPLLIAAARPCRHTPGDRWLVDKTPSKQITAA
jgi:transposase-like protein